MPDTAAPLCELHETTLDRIEQACDNVNAPKTISTGFRDIDNLLAGTAPPSLLIVGGRPSTGTTPFALDVASHIATSGRPALVFSLELSREEVAFRMLAQDARVNATQARAGQLRPDDWNRLTSAIGRLAAAPAWVHDNPAVTVSEIRIQATKVLSCADDLGLIVVDYLQLISTSTAGDQRADLADITRDLNVLARQLETTVLAIARLGHDLESCDDKRPVLADLHQFGPIERDADAVMFIYRDEMYDPKSFDRGLAEIIVATNRNGPTGTVRLGFLPYCTTFTDATLLAD